MEGNVFIALLGIIMSCLAMTAVDAVPPFSITIECGSPKRASVSQRQPSSLARLGAPPTLCDCIQRSLPSIQDGRLTMSDQQPAGGALATVSLPPPRGFLPQRGAGSALSPERIQKGVQKMMHVNNMLGHFNVYMSDRAKVIVKGLHSAYVA